MNPFQGDLIWVLLILVLLFGATRLPKLARSIGQSTKEFKEGMREGYHEQPVEGPCPFCKAHVPAESKFCPGCGKSADDIVAAKEKAAPAASKSA